MKTIKLKILKDNFNEVHLAVNLYRVFNGQFLNETSRNPDKYFRSKISKYKNDSSFLIFLERHKDKSLIELVNFTGIAVNFWVLPSEQLGDLIIPRLVRSIHCSSPFHGTVNLILNRESDDFNYESGLRLIVDNEFIHNIHNTCVSFNQNIAKYTGYPLSYIDQIWTVPFSFLDERDFAKLFGFGFEIWEADTKYCKLEKKLVTVTKRLFKSSQVKFVTLQVVNNNWDHEKYMISNADLFVLRKSEDFQVFICPNEWCFYNTNKSYEFKRHTDKCTNQTKVKFCQRNLLSETPKEYLIRKGLMSDYNSFNLVAFDIETFGVKEDTFLTEKTLIKTSHRMVSISVTPNFGDLPTKVFMRDDWSEESLDKVIKEFWLHLLMIKDEHIKSIPQEIHHARDRVEDLLTQNLPPNEKAQLYRCKKYIKSIFKLKLIGFNNESFDNVVLFPSLLKYWDPINSNSKDRPLRAVRRGNGLMTINFEGVDIDDAHNFYVSGNLDSFGNRFGAPVQKLIWPYEHFDCISQLQTTDWPKYKCFQNTLKQFNDTTSIIESMQQAYEYARIHLRVNLKQFFDQFDIYEAFQPFLLEDVFPNSLTLKPNSGHFFPVNPLTYVQVWDLYQKSLERGEFFNLRDYLKYYNQVDTIVTATAFTNMAKLFDEKFNINILEYPSLPSAALQILWKNYDKDCDAPYTFSQKYEWVANEFRKNLQGGLAGPMHIHLEIGSIEQQFFDTVHLAPDGNPFVEFRVDDMSNLYGKGMLEDLPAGMGHLFTKNEKGNFDTELMMDNKEQVKFKAKFSKESLDWLSYQQSKPEFRGHRIQHYCNGGEKLCTIENVEFHPDGFLQINGHNYYFQYMGCAYHNHGCEISKRSPFLNNDFDRRCRKINDLCQKDGTLFEIYSCQWINMRKTLTYNHCISRFFNRKDIKEKVIFDAIISGDIFGFVCCDIRSPQHVIDFYMKLNWPPVMSKVTPEPDMISPFILERMQKQGKKIETEQLTQTFHADEHLISTNFFQFYHSVGIELTNIRYVVEYTRCKPVKKFVEEVTECRKQAVLTNQKELQEIYKV